LSYVYVKATIDDSGVNINFIKKIVNKNIIFKDINWAKEFLNIKKQIVSYPVEEVKLHFKEFNNTNIDKRESTIFSINFDTQKYDFECIKIVLENENIIYSYVKETFNVKLNVIIDNMTNKNIIKIKTKNCLIK
jgi:hypothetical protein